MLLPLTGGEYKQRLDILLLAASRGEGGVIGGAKVVTEPDQVGHGDNPEAMGMNERQGIIRRKSPAGL